MSSVSSKTGSSGVDERLSAAREDYKKKEAELVKKHNKELKVLTDKYTVDSDKKDLRQVNELKNVREKNNEAMTKKDARFQSEIKELKALQTKQTEKLLQENLDRVDMQAKTSENEIKQTNLGKEDRIQSLHNRYEDQNAASAKKYEESINEIRTSQKETIDKTKEQLEEAHKKELQALKDERNEVVSKLKNENVTLRLDSSNQLKNQELRHNQSTARAESAHMDSIRHEAVVHNEVQDITREGFQESLKDVREKMSDAREKDLAEQNAITQNFHADVGDRMNTEVNRLEGAVNTARTQNIMNKEQEKAKAHGEINKIRDAYQTKFDYLEKARQDTLRQSNEINAQNVRKIHGEADKLVSESSRFNREKSEMENYKNKTAITAAKEDFNLRQQYTADNAQNRVDSIIKDSHENEGALRDNFTQNLEVMKESNQNENRDLRLNLEKDKNAITQMTKQQIQKQEVTHQRQFGELKGNYEKRIEDMNMAAVREKRSRELREKELVKNLGKQKQMEIEALQIKHTEQVKSAELAHEEEMRNVTRRNQEKIDEILRSVKKG